MFRKRDLQKINLYAVGLAIIVFGAAILAYGLVAWLMNTSAQSTINALPSLKIIGGAILIALGYIQLSIELFRHK